MLCDHLLLQISTNLKIVSLLPHAVSFVEDQPNPKVGSGVERAGLSGSDGLFRHPGGEWPFAQVFPFGICLLFFFTPKSYGIW